MKLSKIVKYLDLNKKIKIFICFLFLCFSYLQINDPDYIYWVPVYLLPSLITFYSIFQNNIKFVRALSILYFLSSLGLMLNRSNSDVVMYILPENTNEILGLMMCSMWLCFLPNLKNKN